jgi:hypothetical protein
MHTPAYAIWARSLRTPRKLMEPTSGTRYGPTTKDSMPQNLPAHNTQDIAFAFSSPQHIGAMGPTYGIPSKATPIYSVY